MIVEGRLATEVNLTVVKEKLMSARNLPVVELPAKGGGLPVIELLAKGGLLVVVELYMIARAVINANRVKNLPRAI